MKLNEVTNSSQHQVAGLVQLVGHMDACRECAESSFRECPDAQEIIRDNNLGRTLQPLTQYYSKPL